jgi:hypothetical protein
MTAWFRVGKAGALAAAAAVLCLVQIAMPVPANAQEWETFPFTCAGETFTVTASPGQWSVGHIVGDNGRHLVPYDFSITVTDLETGETLFEASYTKPGNRDGEPVLCENHAEDLDPETGHHVLVDFTSLVHIRGN